MTEIRVVEKKRGRSPWPWLLLLTIPLIWFAMNAMNRRDDGDATRTAADTALTTGTATGDVSPRTDAPTRTPVPVGAAPSAATRTDSAAGDSTVADSSRTPAARPDTTRPPSR